MTDYERSRIVALQSEGYGYKRIAKELDLSVNTVKTFCRRRTAAKSDGKVRCLYCGSIVEQTPQRKKKKYVSRKAGYTFGDDEINLVLFAILNHFQKSISVLERGTGNALICVNAIQVPARAAVNEIGVVVPL